MVSAAISVSEGHVLHNESTLSTMITFLARSDIIKLQSVTKKVREVMRTARKDRKFYLMSDNSWSTVLELDGDSMCKLRDCTNSKYYLHGINLKIGNDIYIFATSRIPMTVTKYSDLTAPSGVPTQTLLSELPIGLASFCVASVVDSFIVLTGGVSIEELVFSKCYEFNLVLNEWDVDSLPDMIEPRFCHSSLALGSKVYVAGGMGKTEALHTTIECLDMSSRTGYSFG